MDVILEKTDRDANCYRFYKIQIMDDLFEEKSVLVHWGRIGCRGRAVVRSSGSQAECRKTAESILQMRLKRGYDIIAREA